MDVSAMKSKGDRAIPRHSGCYTRRQMRREVALVQVNKRIDVYKNVLGKIQAKPDDRDGKHAQQVERVEQRIKQAEIELKILTDHLAQYATL